LVCNTFELSYPQTLLSSFGYHKEEEGVIVLCLCLSVDASPRHLLSSGPHRSTPSYATSGRSRIFKELLGGVNPNKHRIERAGQHPETA